MGDGAPGFSRDSFASHGYPSERGSEYNDSVYALNADPNTRSSTYRDDPSSPGYGVPMAEMGSSNSGSNRFMEEKRSTYAAAQPRSKRRKFIIIGAIIAALLAVAIALAVYFTVGKKDSNSDGDSDSDSSNTGGNNNGGGSNGGRPVNYVKTGGDGSEITMEDGTKFTYNNTFGGHWYWDANDPLNNNAQAQEWTSPLNTSFKYGVERIRGVNLGGWLNTEPFIVPALYEKYLTNANPPIDEWTLTVAMAEDTGPGGGLEQMEEHYKTFITEQDFAQIAAAGLNWIRLPIGWWAIEVREGEPFLPRVSWTYFLKAIQWARKYGLRIQLDLHATPGSQNGWNHSGRFGTCAWLNGPMGYANGQRGLDYIRILAEFISQPQYSDVVCMFNILNEPLVIDDVNALQIGRESLRSFYVEAYKIIREISGIGEGKGPLILYHDGFLPRNSWPGFLTGADRIGLDSHPYLCFNNQQSPDQYSAYANVPCRDWAKSFNDTMTDFGLVTSGEWSNAVTDCGLFVNGVNLGTRYEGTYEGVTRVTGDCLEWTDYQNWSTAKKADILRFAMASMDAFGNYFFWTWRIGESLRTGKVESPQWSYKLGLQEGWMPLDPREADGICGSADAHSGLAPWQTGGTGAGDIPAASMDLYPWPPASIAHAGPPASLPSYTPTGTIVTLPHPTFATTSGDSVKVTATPDLGNGWAHSADRALMAVNPSGCDYLDPWMSSDAAVPALCTGAAAAKRDEPMATPAP